MPADKIDIIKAIINIKNIPATFSKCNACEFNSYFLLFYINQALKINYSEFKCTHSRTLNYSLN